jgi:hypothetical protein
MKLDTNNSEKMGKFTNYAHTLMSIRSKRKSQLKKILRKTEMKI